MVDAPRASGTAHSEVFGVPISRRVFVTFSLATAAASLLLPMVLAYGEKPPMLLAAGIALAAFPVVAVFLFAYPNAIPYLLILAVHFGLLDVKLTAGPLNLRPNMLLALAAACVLAFRVVWMSDRCRPLPFVTLFLAVDSVYLLSTLVNSSSPFFWRGVGDCGLFLINVLQYSLIVWFFASDRQAFERAVRLFLVLTSIYAGANVVAFVLGEFGIGFFAHIFQNLEGETGDFVRVKNLGTTQGTYLGFALVVMLAFLLVSGRHLPFSKLRWSAMLGVTSGALVLTFARGPWLAVVASLAMLLVVLVLRFPRRNAMNAVLKLILVLTLLAGAGGILARTLIADMFATRIEAFGALDTGTAADRMILWLNMWEDWKQAPWLGHGAHDYAKFREDPTGISENFPLELLHSAGLIGFGIFVVAISRIGLRSLRLFASPAGIARMPWGLPLLAGFVAMCLSSLTNPGMTGGYFWTGMALLVCAQKLGDSTAAT